MNCHIIKLLGPHYLCFSAGDFSKFLFSKGSDKILEIDRKHLICKQNGTKCQWLKAFKSWGTGFESQQRRDAKGIFHHLITIGDENKHIYGPLLECKAHGPNHLPCQYCRLAWSYAVRRWKNKILTKSQATVAVVRRTVSGKATDQMCLCHVLLDGHQNLTYRDTLFYLNLTKWLAILSISYGSKSCMNYFG